MSPPGFRRHPATSIRPPVIGRWPPVTGWQGRHGSDYFNGRHTRETDHLDAVLSDDIAATGDLILVEVLQGFRDDSDFVVAKRALSKLPSFDLLGCERAARAASRCRELRKAEVTVRKTVDVIIGSFCIDEGLPLLFSDRDFLPMVEHFGLVPVIRLH